MADGGAHLQHIHAWCHADERVGCDFLESEDERGVLERRVRPSPSSRLWTSESAGVLPVVAGMRTFFERQRLAGHDDDLLALVCLDHAVRARRVLVERRARGEVLKKVSWWPLGVSGALTRLAASSVRLETYRVHTTDSPSVTQKFIRLGCGQSRQPRRLSALPGERTSSTPACFAQTLKSWIVASMAACISR